MATGPVTFVSYSRYDAPYLRRLKAHLISMKRLGQITLWDDTMIDAGTKWRPVLDDALERAEIALFLVSTHFLGSDFCQSVELARFLERSSQRTTLRLIPIIVDYCDWQSFPWIAERQILPHDGKPVRGYRPQSRAWLSVVQELRAVVAKHHGPLSRGEIQSPPRASQRTERQVALDLLPATDPDLFGRDRELALLDHHFKSRSSNVLLFYAFGGVGKTALLRTWIEKLNRPGVNVFAYSFFSQGAQEQYATSEQFIHDSLRRAGDPDPKTGSTWARARRLAAILRSQPTIVALDGIESLQRGPGDKEGSIRDSGLRELLACLAEPGGEAFTVVTSRLPIRESALTEPFCHQIPLEMLPEAAAIEILKAHGIAGAEVDLTRAVRYLGCHSLALVLASEYVSTFGNGTAREIPGLKLIREETRAGRHAKSVLAAYAAALRREGARAETRLLTMLGLFDRPAPRTVLKSLAAALSPKVTIDLDDTLNLLRQWGLIISADEEIDVHPLVREYFGDELRRKRPAEWRTANRCLATAYLAYADSISDDTRATELRLQSVAHLCKASAYADAYREVLLPLALRGDASYSVRQLGLVEGTLSAVKKFFEPMTWLAQKGIGPQLAAAEVAALRRLAIALLTAVEGYSSSELRALLDVSEREAIDAGSTDELFYFRYGRWRYFSGSAELTKALTVATELQGMARRGDAREHWVAIRALATTLYRQGRIAEAASYSGKAAELGDAEAESGNWLLADSPVSNCLLVFALCKWHEGRGATSDELIRRAMSRVKDGEPHVRMVADYLAAYAADFRRDYTSSKRYAEEMVELSGALGFRWWYIVGILRQGWVQGCEGDAEGGIRTIRKGLLMWNETGARIGVPYWTSMLAELELTAGNVAGASLALSEGAEMIRQTGERWWEPEVCRMRGMTEERQGVFDVALSHYQSAVQAAVRIGSVTLELRARVSLANLAAFIGRRDLAARAVALMPGNADETMVDRQLFAAARLRIGDVAAQTSEVGESGRSLAGRLR